MEGTKGRTVKARTEKGETGETGKTGKKGAGGVVMKESG